MPLVGIIAKRKEIQAIKKEINDKNIEIVEITKDSIKNVRNIGFEEIIFLQNINLKEDEYKYMKEIILNTKYLIINGDIEIGILKNIKVEKTIKIITFGFNSKSTITISSIKDEKIIVCLQRDIEKTNGEIFESQEKEIISQENKNIYNNLVVFIIKEFHNQWKADKIEENLGKIRKK